MKHFSAFIKILLLLLSITAVPTLHAQENNGITITVKAGFDGFYKSAFGVPVQVTVANSGPAVTGQLRIELGSGGKKTIYTSPISLPTQSEKRVTLYVHIDGYVNAIEVELRDEKKQIVAVAHSGTLNHPDNDHLLYGIISPDPGELGFLENVTGSRGGAAVAFLDLADLPAVPSAWHALDVLVLNDVDTGQLTAGQRTTLEGWVESGGQLVITGGPGWQKTTASLADLLPVTVTGSESVADLPALSQQMGKPFRDLGPYLIADSSLRRGELLAHQDGLPILAADRMGRGSIYFLALDPKLAPLLDWDGSDQLWAKIANRVPSLPDWASGIKDQYAATTAVSSLPSLALPSVLNMALFLFTYVIIVGPVNYFILKRLKRRELAWATIPVIIIFFAVLAYITGFQIKGNDTIVNQMSIAYGQADGGQMRVQTLLGLYSPRRTSYDVSAPEDVLLRPFNRNFSNGRNIDAIRRDSQVTLEGVRVDVSGTETFIADYMRPSPAVTGQATLSSDSTAITLNATLQNNSDITLETATLLIGDIVIEVGDLKPGKTVIVNERISTSSGSGFGAYGSSGHTSPLMSHSELILGTPDYYNDRDIYPRWQLLQAIANASHGGGTTGSGAASQSTDIITLVAWSDQPQLDVTLGDKPFNTMGTTLYLLELPLTRNLVSGGDISVPLTFMDWELVNDSGVYDASIYDLYLEKDAWADFEFTPWPEFQTMQVTGLSIVLESYDTSGLEPEIRLWDWKQANWGVISPVRWGEMHVGDGYSRFIGPNNAVRIHVQGSQQYGQSIDEIYPILTGNLE